MFNTIFTNGNTVQAVMISLGVALIVGVIFACACYYKTKSTKSFLVATALLPFAVTLVIILVNGNIGAGVAMAGAFGLVRFRSAPGTAREISTIFIAMASGLAFGMGYIAYGVIFMLVAGGALMVFAKIKIFERKPNFKEKIIRITMPECLDYTQVFDEVLAKFTSKNEIVKIKTINMGSMFKVDYKVTLIDEKQEKQMIDEIRTLNGNLEISVLRVDYAVSEL